jgi:hypothetical protein
MKRDVEMILALHTCRPAIVLAPVLALVFWFMRGPGSAGASVLGVVLVAGNLLLSGYLLSLVVRRRPQLLAATALLSFVLRLALLTATLVLLQQATGLDRVAAAVSAVVAYLVMVIWEVVAVARGRHRELEWTP